MNHTWLPSQFGSRVLMMTRCSSPSSTLDAAALCKMAGRGQIAGRILDAPPCLRYARSTFERSDTMFKLIEDLPPDVTGIEATGTVTHEELCRATPPP